MNDRDMVLALHVGRIGVGVGGVLAPHRSTRAWVGPANAASPAVRVITRAFGVRDAALGVIALKALDEADDDRLAAVLRVCAVCDVVDAAATVAAFRHLPKATRFLTLAMATSAAVIGFRAASRL
ncbi:MAG: hypothetical protein ACRDJP_04785 [Actinomycetota bacterium]